MSLGRRWVLWVMYLVAIGAGVVGATALWDAISR